MPADHAMHWAEGLAVGVETAGQRVLAFPANRAGNGAEFVAHMFSPCRLPDTAGARSIAKGCGV